MKNFTPHQQKIIKRYYQNFDAIKLQRLGETIAELYLSEGKKRERLWSQIEKTLLDLEVPAARVEHLIAKKSPELLAKLLEELNSR